MMGLTLGAIVLNVKDTGAAAEFWREALGFEAQAGNPGFLLPKGGPPTRLHLDENDRTHLDLWVDGTSMDAEVDRLIALGARRVEDWTYPEDADFVVLQAPDGTIFCIIE
jgi:catechol 2,3-dioxygenase-like lactoylglutathione lyase family enzyme